MNKLCIVMLIFGLMLGGSRCSRSTEESEAESKVMEGKKFEEGKSFEGEGFEEETETQEEEAGEETDFPAVEGEWGD